MGAATVTRHKLALFHATSADNLSRLVGSAGAWENVLIMLWSNGPIWTNAITRFSSGLVRNRCMREPLL